MEIISIIFTAVFVLFLPGFTISFVFFSKGKIDLIERIALSFALSIAVIPLIVFYTNLLGIPITKISVILQIIFVLAITGSILAIKFARGRFITSKIHLYHKAEPSIHHARKSNQNRFLTNIHIISDELFKASLVTYLFLLIMETVKEGFVSYFFNPAILLGIVIVSGIGMAVTRDAKPEEKKETEIRAINWFYIFYMSFLGGTLVYIKTKDLGNFSLFIAAATFILVVLISYLIFREEE